MARKKPSRKPLNKRASKKLTVKKTSAKKGTARKSNSEPTTRRTKKIKNFFQTGRLKTRKTIYKKRKKLVEKELEKFSDKKNPSYIRQIVRYKVTRLLSQESRISGREFESRLNTIKADLTAVQKIDIDRFLSFSRELKLLEEIEETIVDLIKVRKELERQFNSLKTEEREKIKNVLENWIDLDEIWRKRVEEINKLLQILGRIEVGQIQNRHEYRKAAKDFERKVRRFEESISRMSKDEKSSKVKQFLSWLTAEKGLKRDFYSIKRHLANVVDLRKSIIK